MALKVSQGSGATLATNVLGGEHFQIISPVSIYPLPAGANFIGLATTVLGAALPAGTNFLGGVTVFGNITSNTGNVTLNPGPNYIGLVTSFPAAATTYIGLTSVSGNVNLLNAIPAGTNNIGDVDVLTLPALPAGANYIGLASVNVANTVPVSQSGTWNVGITGLTSLASGTQVGLNAGNNNIGDVDVLTLPALPAGANYIGLTSTVISNTPLVSLPSGFGPMIPISTYTSLATVISATGNATLFTPPAGQRWILKDLLVSSLGRGEVEVKSGANTVIPMTALATTGGYIYNGGDSGLPAKAVDNAFVLNLNGAATISVVAVVRFT